MLIIHAKLMFSGWKVIIRVFFYFFFHQESKVEDYIPLPSTEQFQSVAVSTSKADSVVPLTLGPRRKNSDEVRWPTFITVVQHTKVTITHSSLIFHFVCQINRIPLSIISRN